MCYLKFCDQVRLGEIQGIRTVVGNLNLFVKYLVDLFFSPYC